MKNCIHIYAIFKPRYTPHINNTWNANPGRLMKNRLFSVNCIQLWYKVINLLINNITHHVFDINSSSR